MTLASYKPTPKQIEADAILGGNAKHCMLFGGSRSGKTFKLVRSVILRALAAPNSRHAILRFRFNHVKTSIIQDTFPKVMALCFPGVEYTLDKTDWFATLPNKSQIYFGGLDDKDRTEKILGQEFATIYLNECSQIPYGSRNMAITRLAQNCEYEIEGVKKALRLKMYYDCNPPSQAHWTYQVFVRHVDPESKQALDAGDYAALQMNPADNADNLPPEYISTLESLPARLKKRFLEGAFADITEGALFTSENLDTYRALSTLPDMQRIVIAVDPSGADSEDGSNDAIGIAVVGLGTDGNAYVLEDLTVKAGPSVWGNIVGQAFDRHAADKVVGETNYGGGMVEHVIQTARPRTPYSKVTATRGKVVRAEPISALFENGKVRMAGFFPELEDELCAFTTRGYQGASSPNRADAVVWACYELFPSLIRKDSKVAPLKINLKGIV